MTAALLCGLYLFGQNSPQTLLQKLCREECLKGAACSIYAETLDGKKTVDVNSPLRLVPASNLKLLTTGTALYTLGKDFRFETTLACSGEICDSTLLGNVVIIGGGDPSLGASDREAKDSTAVMEEWKNMLRGAGIARIGGRVVADTTFFDGRGLVGSWMLEDIGSEDAVEVSGLNWKENRDCSCETSLRNYLEASGMPVEGRRDSLFKDTLTVIGNIRSAALKDMVKDCNYHSDNLYAECFLRMLGKARLGSADYASANMARLDVLGELGMSKSALKLCDGSGLSRKNYVSALYIAKFLKLMSRTGVYEEYLESLPHPGEGTLKDRLKNAPDSFKERVFMKSGSMGGILCYSGYILPENPETEQTVAFSILVNNLIEENKKILPVIDRMIEGVAGVGHDPTTSGL